MKKRRGCCAAWCSHRDFDMKISRFIIALILFPALVFADPIEQMGTILQFALPIFAAGITVKKRDTDGFKKYLLNLGVSTATTYGLKYGITERRPNGDAHSFPSEHAALAFSSAGYLWRRYGYQYGIPATIFAGFVGYSRIESHKHYWHDVVAGAAIGLLSSVIVTKPFQIICSNRSVAIIYEHCLSD